jgi:RimJ/RimL family protein N-acetyltransferase
VRSSIGDLSIAPLTSAETEALAGWRYEPLYDFYDGDFDPVLNPERYFIARDETDELVGFYYFEQKDDALEYGLGLRPELVGHGLGPDFVQVGLEFGRDRFRPQRVILSVAAFNERARLVYERAGFHGVGRHIRTFQRWGDVEFIDMVER